MITRKLALGFVGFSLTGLIAVSASAQATPPAPAPTPAPTTTPAAPPPAGSSADEDAKKKAAATAPPAAPPPTVEASATVTIGTPPAPGTAGTGAAPKKDEPSPATPPAAEAAPAPNPWRGSLLILDQSMTTNSFSKGSQMSYSPVYEWWISPRVRYTVGKVSFGIRQDFFKEFTNTQEFTSRGEWRLTDPWLTASYPIKLSEHWRAGLSWTLRPGLSKDSRANGQYVSTGPGGNVGYSFDIRGEKAKSFKTANLSATFAYWQAIQKNTTAQPFSGDFAQARTNAEGQAILDNQLRSATLPGSMMVYSLNAGFDIIEHLDYSISMIGFTQFSHRPTEATFDGQVVERSPNDTRVRQFTWFLTSLTYQVVKEASLSLGYYNLSSVLSPSGNTYRNPIWSPEARIYFDVYVHLDALYERFTGSDVKKGGGGGKGAGRVF